MLRTIALTALMLLMAAASTAAENKRPSNIPPEAAKAIRAAEERFTSRVSTCEKQSNRAACEDAARKDTEKEIVAILGKYNVKPASQQYIGAGDCFGDAEPVCKKGGKSEKLAVPCRFCSTLHVMTTGAMSGTCWLWVCVYDKPK